MAKSSALTTLIDLTKDKTNDVAKQLQNLTSSRQSAHEQLETLHTYRQDYAQRLQQAMTTGLSAANYHNFRQFIATLDDAISQQNKVVAQIDANVELRKKEWVDQKRQLSSYETLLNRQERQAAQRENRIEQRTNDELSMNLFRRAHHSH
ncbi:flagellar export protein FliJ [Neopusillimonas maritima]|jgi:flagellar FliJ protein|uniref:Flagellar FliJ protein n=1 Tax=Neopusillimonas maritima TaxID=2026239 RepID=A0A3A1YP26_9BURK|nr:flagellar export protein FliJ [Neopusillimonas maritima]RIY39922.1 flagellar export protein FliJ [Neopusillimonas maritima]|tara:strand:- start:844 stop:1293 length:450 start_codon:yes stop_codon:yes gene_type:complete